MKTNLKHPSSFPFAGEYFRSQQRKYSEVVFFVHFFGGSKKALKRHIDFVNELGFDAFAFNLAKKFDILHPPVASNGKFGLKHVYALEIETLLNQIPEKKIVFAFSNLAASAIEAMARRNCQDTVALICDSGPSGKFIQSAYNLYTYELKTSLLPWRLAKTALMWPMWSLYLHQDVHPDLDQFPEKFRVLSIRGWKDKLIAPDHIDEIFDPHPRLQWQKLNLPEAGHLVGLRDYPQDYKPIVQKFLAEVATLVTSLPGDSKNT